MAEQTSIGIVGTGWVGSSVAISSLHNGVAQEVLLHDRAGTLAEGEAMDLSHGSSFYPSARVRAVDIEEMLATKAVVIAAGRGGDADETRLELLRDNAAIIGELAQSFRAYEGTVVVVTNPVDVLTYVFQKESGLPPERVIGTGTMLDTTRLRQVLGRELTIDPRSIHAQVIGEHGDSEVCIWSQAMVGGTRIRERPDWAPDREKALETEVRESAYRIIARKGATNHAIGLVTANLLQGMLRNERRALTVSRVQDGAFGLEDVALSLPAVVGSGGASMVLEPQLDQAERDGLVRSASVLNEAIESVAGA
ncbi:MAG: lactate/malate family dehydrogenase [Actinomycetota bacterium]